MRWFSSNPQQVHPWNRREARGSTQPGGHPRQGAGPVRRHQGAGRGRGGPYSDWTDARSRSRPRMPSQSSRSAPGRPNNTTSRSSSRRSGQHEIDPEFEIDLSSSWLDDHSRNMSGSVNESIVQIVEESLEGMWNINMSVSTSAQSSAGPRRESFHFASPMSRPLSRSPHARGHCPHHHTHHAHAHAHAHPAHGAAAEEESRKKGAEKKSPDLLERAKNATWKIEKRHSEKH